MDKCMINLIELLNYNGVKTLACCCGHRKYNPTIIMRVGKDGALEILSGIFISRKKRFYVKDKDGYYYIPEVEDKWNGMRCRKRKR